MPTLTPGGGVVRFAAFEVDLCSGELRKQGLRVRLQEQPFQVLAILLERSGEVVTREEIRRRLWGEDTFIDYDHSLGTAINKIREALGDSADNPRFVETLPRRGYRFIYPIAAISSSPVGVHQLTDAAATAGTGLVPARGRPQGAPLRRRWSFALGGLALIAVAVAVFLALNFAGLRDRLADAGAGLVPAPGRPQGAPLQIHSIAVLPLENLSGDPEQEYFADGMTDELITRLAQIQALRVISFRSVMQYKTKRKPTPAIAHELNVDAVVEGTILRSGNRVRISAQLIQANPEKHLWAQSYEGDLHGVLTLQRDVALAIVDKIRIAVKPQDQIRLADVRPVNPEAHELDLRGRFFWNKLSVEGFQQGVKYFQQAAEKDPNDGMAYAGLADSYLFLWIWGALPAREGCSLARDAAVKALAIDESLAEAHASLARVRFECDWNWPAAEKEFRRAIELNPSYVNRATGYPFYLAAMGRQKEALAEIRRDHSLDPNGLITNFKLAGILFLSRHIDQAIGQYRETLELYPDSYFTQMGLVETYERNGMHKEAIDAYQKALALHGASEERRAALRHAYETSGTQGFWQLELKSLKAQVVHQSAYAYNVAKVYAYLGEKDRAIEWLEEAYRSRNSDMVYLQVDPTFDPLHSHPRFQDLVRRMNFPK